MAIKKIIVELADAEATFHEFNSIDEFQTSEVYKKETEKVTDAETVEVPVEPAPEPKVETQPTE